MDALWSGGREVALGKKAEQETWASCLSPTQEKLAELQAGKKSLEDQVEMLRLVKEEAEKPEKEAKDQHQKRWEGMSRAGQGRPLSLAGKRLGPGASLITCWLTCLLTIHHGASVPHVFCWLHLCVGHCIRKSFVGITCHLAEGIFFPKRRCSSFCQPHGNTAIGGPPESKAKARGPSNLSGSVN